MFRAVLDITHSVWPSMTPAIGVNLPLLRPVHDNDNLRAAAQA